MLQPIDPAGGSWAVETLTRQMKEKIWAEFQSIEKSGGILEALRSGSVQEGIAKILADRFKNADLRKDRIVGNNMYPNMTEQLLDPRTEDTAELLEKRKKDVEAYLADVDEAFKRDCLAALKSAGRGEKAEAAVKAAADDAEKRKAAAAKAKAEQEAAAAAEAAEATGAEETAEAAAEEV